MTLLKLPLAISSAGVLEQADRNEDTISPRIRFFLYRGMGEYQRLSPQRERKLSAPHSHPSDASGSIRSSSKRQSEKLLRKQGISAVWSQLYIMGQTSRLSALFEGEDGKSDLRTTLETAIKDQINEWFDGIATIESVRLLPYKDPEEQGTREENGILIRTERMNYTFIFEYAQPGKTAGAIGSWRVKEEFYAR
jgi:hypothetical protein